MVYTVKLPDKEVYDTCEKHHLKLVDANGNKITRQRVSFSDWQLKDDKYNDRVKQWAARRIEEDINRKKDIKVDYSL